MPSKKEKIRAAFRLACFKRDKYTCIGCGFKSNPVNAEVDLDAHHINDRHTFVNGGYIAANGATLCKNGNNCHLKAEMWLQNGTGESGFSPTDLYAKINSSREKADKEDNAIH